MNAGVWDKISKKLELDKVVDVLLDVERVCVSSRILSLHASGVEAVQTPFRALGEEGKEGGGDEEESLQERPVGDGCCGGTSCVREKYNLTLVNV